MPGANIPGQFLNWIAAIDRLLVLAATSWTIGEDVVNDFLAK
jgi:hypothetical protein